MNIIKNNYILIIIFIVFLGIRIFNFTNGMWYEGFSEVVGISELISIGSGFINSFPHFPLSFILYKIGALAVGNTIIGVKIMHLLLNIITFFLIYKTSILFYNDKRVANWSILLYAISFYAYAGNTMGIDQDLALNPLLFILSIYLYKKLDLSKFKNNILLGLSCALLSSSRLILGVIMMGIIFVDILINNMVGKQKKTKCIFDSIYSFIKIFVPYLLLLLILIYLMYKVFPDAVISELISYKNLLFGSGGYEGAAILTRLSFLGQVFLYVSPLILLVFPLLNTFKKHQILLVSSVIMILYMLVGTSGGDPARWMMPILPVLAILRGFVCSKYINRKNWRLIGVIVLVLCGLNYILLDYSFLPNNVSDYLSSPLNKVFILSTTVFAPVYINSRIVFGIVGITIILLTLAILWENKISKYIFIAFALGVNIFLIIINMFQIKQPHITDIVVEMSSFCFENCSINDNIYSDSISKDVAMMGLWNKYIGSYFSFNLDDNIVETNYKLHENPFLLSGINLFSQNYPASDYINTIKNNGSGFVFVTKYFGNEKEIDLLSEKCEIIEKFTGNIDEIYGIVYECNF